MDTHLKLCVYRRLDNRIEGLGDDSPRPLELHNRRKDALHSVFDGEPVICAPPSRWASYAWRTHGASYTFALRQQTLNSFDFLSPQSAYESSITHAMLRV
jgi:hypothetical protein